VIEVCRGSAALQGLRAEWVELWERCPQLTPFQHPDWLIPWSRHFGGDVFLTITLRRRGTLVGLAPFVVIPNPAGRRDLLLLGTGNTDYLDLLVEPAIGGAGAAAMLHAALAAAECDSCDLRQLRPGSPLLGAAAGGEWGTESVEDEPCPVLGLPTSVGELSAVMRSGHLNRVRRDRRRLERRGRVEAMLVEEADFGEAFNALVHLHQSRWSEAGQPGIFADPAVVAFHREVAHSFLDSGWLRLRVLRFEGRIIATQYAFTCRRHVYNYLGGYDTEFSHWSPGTLVLAESIEAAIREEATAFDFLRGRESYKYLWGGRDTLTYRRRLERRSVGAEVDHAYG
jgi:CelD/BcsL family acetyltransferase involved in cellulose biosynthesis